MAVIITDQFKLRQGNFLDDRQGLSSVDSLRDWDTSTNPIPDGFEVCVEGIWYVFKNSNADDPETGRFRKRQDEEKSIVEIEYSDLVELRDNSGLAPSCWYRITDYETILSEEYDWIQSAGNLFDILVLATSKSTLSENALAIQTERDINGYFANSKLNVWELKYSIDNDLCDWGNTGNGKGIIYYLKDEFENEAGYDFKNIQYKRYPISSIQLDSEITQLRTTLEDSLIYENNGGKCLGYVAGEIGAGHFLSLISEDDSSKSTYHYTFDNGSGEDKSLTQDCMYNKITFSDTLPNIVLLCGSGVYGNKFNYCYDLTLGDGYLNNVFEGCYNTIFEDSFENNFINAQDSVFIGDGYGNNNINYLIGGVLCGNIITTTISGINSDIVFYGSSQDTTLTGNSVIIFKRDVNSVTVESPNKIIKLDGSVDLTNIILSKGLRGKDVSGNYTYLSINHTSNNDIQTIYQPANSQTISVNLP